MEAWPCSEYAWSFLVFRSPDFALFFVLFFFFAYFCSERPKTYNYKKMNIFSISNENAPKTYPITEVNVYKNMYN
ncbi:hypothetical protein HanPI659440_Chr05g0204861 [Helianthus annuus]|nr:hypothetical protein HanPI659440_Chr05g0204861 [Helianthus annuus]